MILQQAVTLLCLCAIGLASPSWAAFPGQKLRISIDASVIPNDVSEETLHLLEQVLAEVQIEARTEENSADLKKAFEMREIDLLLTSAALYRSLGMIGARDIATLASEDLSNPNKTAGAAVFVQLERADLNDWQDLSNKKIAYSSEWGLDGNTAFRAELVQHGILNVKFENIKPHASDAIRRLLEGEFDALVLPVCLLEKTAAKQFLMTDSMRVLSPRSTEGTACVVSTKLFPGIVAVASPSLTPALSRSIASALLSAGPDSSKRFWTEATDFSELDSALRLLDLDAYADLRKWSLRRLWTEYKPWFLFALMGLIALGLHSVVLSRLVNRRTAELADALCREKLFEQQAQVAARRISKMERIGLLGQVTTLFAHEVRQPLSVIAVYAYGLRRQIEKGRSTEGELIDGLKKIEAQNALADSIVKKVRNWLRQKGSKRELVNLLDVIQRSCATFLSSGKRRADLQFNGNSRQEPIYIYADYLDLELVLLNLLRNAEEAQTTVLAPFIHLDVFSDGKEAYVRIVDNGPPLDESSFKRITAAMETTKPEGLGLGLSLVNSIIEAQGGRIKFTQSEVGGLSVTLSLPLVQP